MALTSIVQMQIPRGGTVVVLVTAFACVFGGEAQAVPSTCIPGPGGIFTITTGDPGGPPAPCFDLIGGAAIAGAFLNTFPDGRVTGAGSAVGAPMSGAGEQGTRLDIELRGSGVALIDPTFFTNFGGQPAGDYRTSYRLTGSLQKTPGELTLILGSWDPRFTGVPQPGAPPELFDLLPPLAGTFPVNRFETAFGPGGGGVTLTQDWAIALVSLDDNAVLRARFFETGEGAFVVPEPTTLLLWGTMMAGLGLAARWRQRRKN